MSKSIPFNSSEGPLAKRISIGLAKIGQTLKNHAWEKGALRGLTPTQGQILSFLRQCNKEEETSLGDITASLGVTAATISDAVQSLVEKGFVTKEVSQKDKRFVVIVLTPQGRKEAEHFMEWPDFLSSAIGSLAESEQEVFYLSLLKMIRELQIREDIPVSRMCVTCQYFQPHVYTDKEKPHHCAFVDAAFGNKNLRIHCPDHQEATREQKEHNGKLFEITQ
jgi:DNA-binding MarR family transcriptional regulator